MIVPSATRPLQWIRDLNLFKSDASDAETIRIERWSSWIYIVGFLAILSFFSVYTALGQQITTVTVSNPSLASFELLQEKYPATLHCPCSTTSIRRSTFVQAQTTFHQVNQISEQCSVLTDSFLLQDMLKFIRNRRVDQSFFPC